MIRALLWWLAVVLAIYLPSMSFAQPSERKPVIGVLLVAAEEHDEIIDAFRRELRRLGYVEGKDFSLEFRSAKGRANDLPALAQDLVRMNADVIVTGSDAAIRAARGATNRIPIVMGASVYDPVATGLIESFGHPGGNITGSFLRQEELHGKRLELLKQMLPGVSRVAVFADKFKADQLNAVSPAAHALGINLEVLDLGESYDFAAAFARAKRKRCGAVFLLGSPAFYVRRDQIGRLARDARLPVVGSLHDITRQGGLMSYGADLSDMYVRAAQFVDRILKGAKPSDIPIDQAAALKMVVNLRTARLIGISIPESTLMRADEVVK